MLPKNPLLQKCITYLESLPNIQAIVQEEPYLSSNVLADGQLIITNSHRNARYICEIKTGITSNVVEEVAEYFTHLNNRLKPEQRPLLVTRNLSNLVVDQLLERNIEFIDIDGNIYLNSPDFYVMVRNKDAKYHKHKSLEISTAALQVIYTLLKQPELLAIDNDEKIAYLSGVNSKTVKNTLQKLQDLDYITKKNEGYKILSFIKLFERWELGYAEKLRTHLLIGTFSPIGKKDFSEVENAIEKYADVYSYLIGGELAASIITGYLRPIGATLHLDRNVNERQILVTLKLKPDDEGSVVILKSFGHENYQENRFYEHNNNVIDPLLIHAELVCNGNSRLKETAQIIYDKYIRK